MNPKSLIASLPPLLILIAPLLLHAQAPAAVLAQHGHSAQLSEAELEEVRESAIIPNDRVKVFTKILEDRAGKIKTLAGRPKSGQRVLKMDEALRDFTSLMDETGDNLDQYSDRHSDIRRSLKPLNDALPRWLLILRSIPGESGFDLTRKEAIESGEELAGLSTRLMHEQDAYFLIHKEERDQERSDDKVNEPPKP
jgi:hypothetical protein